MRLYLAAKILDTDAIAEEIGKETATQGALMHEAEMFLRSGMSSLAEYTELDGLEKAAMVQANDKIRREMAVFIAQASQGIDGAAEVLEPADGGATSRTLKLGRAVATAAHKVTQTPRPLM